VRLGSAPLRVAVASRRLGHSPRVCGSCNPCGGSSRHGRFTLSPVLDEVRAAIAGEGFAGLERLAKKYGIPVILLTAGLGELTAPAPQGQVVPPPL
jgi:hypothetical protein